MTGLLLIRSCRYMILTSETFDHPLAYQGGGRPPRPGGDGAESFKLIDWDTNRVVLRRVGGRNSGSLARCWRSFTALLGLGDGLRIIRLAGQEVGAVGVHRPHP